MKIIAIKVKQPLGDFYIAKIKARNLLKISYTESFSYDKNGRQHGAQRPVDEKRLKEISHFIKSEEMCFPSSILIAFNSKTSMDSSEDVTSNYNIDKIGDDLYEITIPDDEESALIIDGQHRLFAFNYVDDYEREIELVCSIFFDLPNPYQAYLFATINGNQKRVNKSLSLEFFGYNVEEEPKEQWTPEKLAVFLTRKLNFKENSPLYHKLKLAAAYDNNNDKLASTAAMVEGILSLIASNPKRDRDVISQHHDSWLSAKKSRRVVRRFPDNTPLRTLYIESNDDEIYSILVNFFSNVNEILWSMANQNSVIMKTVGILALFDFLKKILLQSNSYMNIDFPNYLYLCCGVDFSDPYFSTSGKGKGRIKRIMLYLSGLDNRDILKEDDAEYLKHLGLLR
ncbi:DGQHR domain-containing protein [Prevotella sp.]|uniref:DGQHR domain-containing protein n=1 Tax=Prevotella sp. TaxID=59823 RepID=UPI002649ECA7|nr:DGQHR domain-containing protein [Prevotella sp.]MDN5554512.1 DGQHR domain-containing protein [Prevotella sp.]